MEWTPPTAKTVPLKGRRLPPTKGMGSSSSSTQGMRAAWSKAFAFWHKWINNALPGPGVHSRELRLSISVLYLTPIWL